MMFCIWFCARWIWSKRRLDPCGFGIHTWVSMDVMNNYAAYSRKFTIGGSRDATEGKHFNYTLISDGKVWMDNDWKSNETSDTYKWKVLQTKFYGKIPKRILSGFLEFQKKPWKEKRSGEQWIQGLWTDTGLTKLISKNSIQYCSRILIIKKIILDRFPDQWVPVSSIPISIWQLVGKQISPWHNLRWKLKIKLDELYLPYIKMEFKPFDQIENLDFWNSH